jgi:hypothetical protein
MQVVKWLDDYWPLLLAIGGVLDIVTGYLPPKYAAYIGLTRRVARKLAGKEPGYLAGDGKKGSGSGAAAIMILLILTACATVPPADPICSRPAFLDSLICKWTHEAGVNHVEDIRDLLLDANDVSLLTEVYTVDELAERLTKWEVIVQTGGVSYAIFFTGVVDDLEKAERVAGILTRRFAKYQSMDVIRASDQELVLIMIDRVREASGIPIPDGEIGPVTDENTGGGGVVPIPGPLPRPDPLTYPIE